MNVRNLAKVELVGIKEEGFWIHCKNAVDPDPSILKGYETYEGVLKVSGREIVGVN